MLLLSESFHRLDIPNYFTLSSLGEQGVIIPLVLFSGLLILILKQENYLLRNEEVGQDVFSSRRCWFSFPTHIFKWETHSRQASIALHCFGLFSHLYFLHQTRLQQKKPCWRKLKNSERASGNHNAVWLYFSHLQRVTKLGTTTGNRRQLLRL